jgi:hypothetical protein
MTNALVVPGNSSMRVCIREWAETTLVGIVGKANLVELVQGISNVVCSWGRRVVCVCF